MQRCRPRLRLLRAQGRQREPRGPNRQRPVEVQQPLPLEHGGGCSNNGGVPSAYFRTVVPHWFLPHPRRWRRRSGLHLQLCVEPRELQCPIRILQLLQNRQRRLEMQYDKKQGEDVSHETHVFANSYNIFTVKSGMGGFPTATNLKVLGNIKIYVLKSKQ